MCWLFVQTKAMLVLRSIACRGGGVGGGRVGGRRERADAGGAAPAAAEPTVPGIPQGGLPVGPAQLQCWFEVGAELA